MSMTKVYAHRIETDITDPKTGKAKTQTTYHTEENGKGKLVKSIMVAGPSEYYAIKIDGVRVMDKDEQVALIRANSRRLNNPELIKALRRLDRLAERIKGMRKQVSKLTGGSEDLHEELDFDKIISAARNSVESIANACYAPLTGAKVKAETPDIF